MRKNTLLLKSLEIIAVCVKSFIMLQFCACTIWTKSKTGAKLLRPSYFHCYFMGLGTWSGASLWPSLDCVGIHGVICSIMWSRRHADSYPKHTVVAVVAAGCVSLSTPGSSECTRVLSQTIFVVRYLPWACRGVWHIHFRNVLGIVLDFVCGHCNGVCINT